MAFFHYENYKFEIMLAELENGFGLEIVIWLQSMSHPLFDALAHALNIAGGTSMYIVIVLLVYWCFNRQTGIRMGIAVIVAVALTYLLKEGLQTPRPFMVSDSVTPLFVEDSYGIPSGHVAGSLVFAGYIALHLRQRWLTAAVAGYVLLMAWARMYAGVHYPQDVLAGVLTGLIVLAALLRYEDTFITQWNTLPLALRTGIITLAGAALAITLSHIPNALTLAGVLIGFGPALALESRYIRFNVEGTPPTRLLRYAIGISLVIVVLVGLSAFFANTKNPQLFRVIRYALAAMMAFFIWPALGQQLGLFARHQSR